MSGTAQLSRRVRRRLLLRARLLRREAYSGVVTRTTYLHYADAYREAARMLREEALS